MKNPAIFSVVLSGWVAAASAMNIPLTVTTAAQQDALSIGFSETLTQNVGQLPDGAWVNEIDIRETSIGGTYLNGAYSIAADTRLTTYAGTFYVEGGVAYLYGSKPTGADPVNCANTGNGLFGNTDYPGYWEPGVDGSMTTIGLDGAAPSPSFAAAGTPSGGTSHIFEATQITAGEYTGGAAFDITPPPSVNPSAYDNTLLAAFYVSPSVTGVKFYTDDGNPWNVNHSTGGYGQMGFSYGGGRTDYVEINPALMPGDANGDGKVDVNDLTIVLANYNHAGCTWWQGCMDGDPTGTVDVNDLTIVLANYDTTYSSSAAAMAPAPEPSGLVLIGLGAVGLLAFARRRRGV